MVNQKPRLGLNVRLAWEGPGASGCVFQAQVHNGRAKTKAKELPVQPELQNQRSKQCGQVERSKVARGHCSLVLFCIFLRKRHKSLVYFHCLREITHIQVQRVTKKGCTHFKKGNKLLKLQCSIYTDNKR